MIKLSKWSTSCSKASKCCQGDGVVHLHGWCTIHSLCGSTKPSALPHQFYLLILLFSHFHYQNSKGNLDLPLQTLNQPALQGPPTPLLLCSQLESLGIQAGNSIICWAFSTGTHCCLHSNVC